MIDIKELRRTTQAATPGPWYYDERKEEVRADARKGMVAIASIELGWIEPLESEQKANVALITSIPTAVQELLDRLEAAENDVALKERVIDALGSELNAVANERDALRAKIEAMERQEPVAWRWELKTGQYTYIDKPEHAGKNARIVPPYALPGAQAQPAPGVAEGWLRVIDEALVVTHLGVANADDSYEDAKRKLNELIGWHTYVATDPAVNGGFKLMPIEPTPEIHACFTAYDGSAYSNPFDFDDFKEDYTAALAAASEVKP